MSWYADLAARLKALFGGVPGGFDWKTAGPDEDEHPIAPVSGQSWSAWGKRFSDGLWLGAQYRALHPGRLGPVIIPRAVVVHTTDTPDGFQAIVRSWTTTPGARNAAHFIIGRSAADGVVQFARITRNANHAGGTPHGNFKGINTGLLHPNTVSVGIEIVAGGRLKKQGGNWVHSDSGQFVPDSDVEVDARGQGWHKVTDYQYGILDELLRDLWPQLQIVDGMAAVPDGDYAKNGVPWAQMPRSSIVGHATLDPVNKLDPGPFVMQHLRGVALP